MTGAIVRGFGRQRKSGKLEKRKAAYSGLSILCIFQLVSGQSTYPDQLTVVTIC